MSRTIPTNATLIPKVAEKVFTGEIFDVYQWPQTLFDGSTATFEMLRRPDTVSFIVIRNDKILLIDEQQPSEGGRMRIPGGRVDAGENWLKAAQRECNEELGMTFSSWRLINVVQPVTKIEWFVATYIATDLLEEYEPSTDAGEQIAVHEYSFEDAKNYLATANDSQLTYLKDIFDRADNLQALKELPEFSGKEV